MSPRVRIVARLPRGRGLSPFVVGSLAAHGVVAVALVLLPTLAAGPRIPEAALVVDLVSAPAPRPAAPPAAATPRRPPAEPGDGVRATAVEPEPAPAEPEPPPPKKKPAEPRRPDPDARRPASPAPPAPQPPAAVGPPGPDAAGGISALDTGNVEFAWYRDSVTAALYSQWRKPVLDGIAEPREVLVAFEIRRDGAVAGLRVERSSGVPSLDRSALGAVSDADPLPPLPAGWNEPTLAARFLFRLYPE